MEESGASLWDYMLRPLDREKLARLEADALESGNGEELRREIIEWNRDRFHAWRRELGRSWKEHKELDQFRSAQAFFGFLEFYSFLARKGLVDEEALSDFRAEIQQKKPLLAGSAHRSFAK